MQLKQRLIFTVVAAAFAASRGLASADPALPAPSDSAPVSEAPAAQNYSDAITQAVARAPSNPIVDDADLWQRVRMGFQLEPLDSPLVMEHEQWYMNRPDYIQRFVERGSKYLHHIVAEVERRNMPMEVALLPVIESAFNPKAYSRSNAAGMWQFIPSTGKTFGLKQDWQADHRRDIVASTNAALNYLEKLHGMFNSWELALAAYNCGEGCVGRAIAANQRKGLPTDFLSLNLPLETRNYVPKLIAVKNIVLSPGSYGIEIEQLPDQPYFTAVKAPAKIDVKLAARLANMPEEEFVALNPAFNRPVAAPEDGQFLLPIGKAEVFRENLENYDQPLVSWTTYNARRGESLDQIGRKYGVSGAYLRTVNVSLKERKSRLAQPTTLMVPLKGAQGGYMRASFEPKSDTRATAPSSLDAPVARTASVPASYRVQRGDTLFGIAQKFSLDVDSIKDWNGLGGSSLAVGQTLKLTAGPAVAAAQPASAAAPRIVKVATTPSVQAASYTIRSGDTLFSVAQKFNVALNDLLRWNRLSPKSVIQPGRKIKVAA